MYLRLLLLILIGFNFNQVAYGQTVHAVADGQTATTVTYDNTGHALVDIAAPVSDGISHNTFTRFNVTQAGLDFDNRFAGARTIIGEVTGSERSLIEGDIES